MCPSKIVLTKKQNPPQNPVMNGIIKLFSDEIKKKIKKKDKKRKNEMRQHVFMNCFCVSAGDSKVYKGLLRRYNDG